MQTSGISSKAINHRFDKNLACLGWFCTGNVHHAQSTNRASRLCWQDQCFFKAFKRVSWWSLRVSTPFSLLCLILCTDFHKNASLRPNMLNYLNTTFTFGKQSKDNFINRKFQCRPAYSFIHFCARFFFGESRGGKYLTVKSNLR